MIAVGNYLIVSPSELGNYKIADSSWKPICTAWRRQATRAVMVLLSLYGLPAAQSAALLDCHPATVRRWISRFNDEGLAGLADRPRCGRPRLGGCRLTRRIAALLTRPGPWTLPRIGRYLGQPQISLGTLYRRVR